MVQSLAKNEKYKLDPTSFKKNQRYIKINQLSQNNQEN